MVFTLTRNYILIGSDVTTFKVLPPNSEQGCNSHKSGKIVNGRPVWTSNDGICTYENGTPRVISKDKLGRQTFNVVNTAVYDEHYYMCLDDGSLFAMDLRFGGLSFKNFDFVNVDITNIGVFNNILYGAVNDGLTNKVATLFDGTDLELTYVSPELTEEDASVTKMYNNVYVRANGLFIFKTLIDGVEVANETLDGNFIFDVKVPQEQQRGSSIQFDIKGTGVIKEIEYKVVGRQNGR
jgi:hypothetical protein